MALTASRLYITFEFLVLVTRFQLFGWLVKDAHGQKVLNVLFHLLVICFPTRWLEEGAGLCSGCHDRGRTQTHCPKAGSRAGQTRQPTEALVPIKLEVGAQTRALISCVFGTPVLALAHA